MFVKQATWSGCCCSVVSSPLSLSVSSCCCCRNCVTACLTWDSYKVSCQKFIMITLWPDLLHRAGVDLLRVGGPGPRHRAPLHEDD